ncbi:MAG TPA: cytochrome c oxidase assembly protein [Streptosporangiaceae bacterium]|nr:cytochrome c oxidase assembly protein [Streptosporangiaceae bacterium]
MSPVLSHWSASWPALISYALVAGAHVAGVLRLRARDGGVGRERRREALLFQSGLLLALLAIVSPLAHEAGIFIWVRAVQDLILAVVAPGLIVVGAPWQAFGFRGSSGGWWLRWPVASVLAFNVIWVVWHIPVLYDRIPASGAATAAEYVLYLAAGTLFWLQVIGSRPWNPVSPPVRRAGLLIGTVAVDTVLGMVLVFGSSVIYPSYTNAAHHVMTVLDDQQLAGAVLWMGMLPPVITAAVAVLVRWLNDEESDALSAGLDRLLTQRSSAWPSRPRFR